MADHVDHVVRLRRTDAGLALVRADGTLVDLPAEVVVPPPAPGIVVTAPAPPSTYVVTSGAQPVRTSTELRNALAQTTARDWVVEDGAYDLAAGQTYENRYGHRVQARNLGKAVMKAGWLVGGNWGAGGGLLQGMAFDIVDKSKTVGGWGHIINCWSGQTGSAKGSRFLDLTFDGHKVLGSAIWLTDSENNVVQRVQAHDLTDYGIGSMGPAIAGAMLWEDLDVWNVSRAVPRSAGGTAESPFWIGTKAIARRLRSRGGAWMGLWTGDQCTDSIIEDLDVAGTAISVYCEHKTTRLTLRKFKLVLPMGARGRGVTCEWYDVFGPGNGSTNDSTFEDGLIEGGHIGAAFNAGCKRNLAQRVKFVGQTIAAIEDLDDEPTTNRYVDNDYTQLAAGAVPVSRMLHNF